MRTARFFKWIAPAALVFATLVGSTQNAHAWGLGVCNIRNANATKFKGTVEYICRLNGVGSFDADSGTWIKHGTCAQSATEESEAAEDGT